eukprot:TRINITY_DN16193_c0_g4_i3.p1 TRINITY_DN16193_c0_g4~~TRINITY_DN16193_c0_g4_i3.p1  ORF type:complete len:251 (-),score=14.29 TRINITY_DN16193_c0_g4_i3:51-803(-)
MGERRSSGVLPGGAQQAATNTFCVTDMEPTVLDEYERLASISEIPDVGDCAAALKGHGSELSCSLALSESSVFGARQDARPMSAPLVHCPVVSTKSVATQTVVLGAKPPRQPQLNRRVNLRTKRRVCPKFVEAPPLTILQIIQDNLWRMNPRGKGCCTSHILLECLLRHTSELLSRPCMNLPEITDAWQCRQCFAINRWKDLDGSFCDVCDADLECDGEQDDYHPPGTSGLSIGDADADADRSSSGECTT